jgi:DNA polymerase III delta prime subunit
MNSTLDKRKINLVQNFLALDNKETISKVEILLNEEKMRIYEESISKKMTHKELNLMLDKAEDDFKNGRIITTEELLKKVENW